MSTFEEFMDQISERLVEYSGIPREVLLAPMLNSGGYKPEIERHERDMWFLERFYELDFLTLAQYKTAVLALFDELRDTVVENNWPLSVYAVRLDRFQMKCFRVPFYEIWRQEFLGFQRRACQRKITENTTGLPQIDPIKTEAW